VEEIAFQAREDKRVDRRSGVSQRYHHTLESLVSSASERAARNGEKAVVARVADVYAALPAITATGARIRRRAHKGADTIARELFALPSAASSASISPDINFQPVIFFQLVRARRRIHELPDLEPPTGVSPDLKIKPDGALGKLGVQDRKDAGAAAAAAEMILEGLWAIAASVAAKSAATTAEKPKQPASTRFARRPAPPPRRPNSTNEQRCTIPLRC